MRGSRLAFFLTLATVAIPPAYAAAMTGDEVSCRETIARSLARYAVLVAKAEVSCHQKRSSGDIPLDTNCNNPDEADLEGLVAGARSAVQAAIGACTGS